MRLTLTVTFIFSLALIGIGQGERRSSIQNQSGVNLNAAEIEGREELVKDAPYVATAIVETTQILADGNRITRTTEQKVARDRMGRTRHEQLLDRIGSLAADAPRLIFISDPVSGQEYTLNTRDKSVTVQKRLDTEILSRMKRNQAAREQSNREETSGNGRPRQIKSEDLGSKVLEGLNVSGERLSATLPTGSVGNERPLELSLETWYSPDLHVFLYRKRTDPRFGEILYRLTSIERKEPDAMLFKIPRDYKYLRNGK